MTKELAIFNSNGKILIGYLCNFSGGEEPSFSGLGTTFTDYYPILAPAEITYELEITTDATADLVSHVMPFYPGGFVNGSKDAVYFAFPKSTTIMSNLKESNIHSNIINQYKQLTGIQ